MNLLSALTIAIGVCCRRLDLGLGANQPSNSKFVFGPATWLRGLIRPESGMSIAYIDYEQQEFAIGAALSNDPAMTEAYRTGDPYLELGEKQLHLF